MAAMDFPASPTVGQVFASGARQWIWTGTVWDAYGASKSTFTPGPTPPAAPFPGDLWWDSNTGRSYIWYDSTWVEMTGAPAVTDAGLLTGSTLASNVVYSSLSGNRNYVYNGDFMVWQRGAGPFTARDAIADLWWVETNTSTHSTTRQDFAVGSNVIPGYEPKHFVRTVVTSVANAAALVYLNFSIQNVRTLAGKQVTVSFWAKADAARPVAVELLQGSTPQGFYFLGKPTLSTTWQRYSYTTTLSTLAGKTIAGTDEAYLDLNIYYDAGSNRAARTGNLGQQSGTFDLWGVQIEEGPVATPYVMRPMTETLQACYREYWRIAPGKPTVSISVGQVVSATKVVHTLWYPVPMRWEPWTLNVSSAAHFAQRNSAGTNIACTSINVELNMTNTTVSFSTNVASGLTAGQSSQLVVTNAAAWLDIQSL